MTAWLLATGLVSLLGQVVLLRELSVAFYGSEMIYILSMGAWLLWSALGAAVGRRSRTHPGTHVRLLFLGFALALPLAVAFARGLRPLFGAVPGAYLPFPQQMLAMLLALCPLGVLSGLLFQWSAKLYVSEGHTLARAYAIESAGGLIGGVLGTLLAMLGVQNLVAGLLCAGVALAATAHPWRHSRPSWVVPLSGLGLAALLIALGLSGQIDAQMTAWNHPNLLVARDTPYGRIALTRAGDQISVFENDALAFESEGATAEELAHLAALQHPAPRTVLVLGGGVEGLVREVLQHQPARVDYVELNRVLVDLVSQHLPRGFRDSLRAGPVRITITDPRRHLAHERMYDLVLVGMPEPESGQANRFYTREFFARCAARLNPGGVLAFRLKTAENVWTPQQARRAGSIHRALRQVFLDVVALPGAATILLASDSPLPRAPDLLCRRFEDRRLATRLVTPPYIRYLYTNDRFASIAATLARSTAPANTDTRPICYQYTLLIWLSKFFPDMTWIDLPTWRVEDLHQSPYSWMALLAIACVLVALRRWAGARRAVLVAVAGLLGMVLETTLLLNYQVTRGVLYQDLGLLLTLFMAGLSLGAAWVARLAHRPSRPGGVPRALGGALLGGFAALSLLIAGLIHAGWVTGLAPTALLLVASGFLVAAVFAYATLQGQPDQRSAVSPLYAADLLGGCLGSIGASLFLVPVVGLTGTAAFLALLALGATLLL